MIWSLGEIFGGKSWSKRLDHQIRIRYTHAATDDSTDVTEQGFPDFVSKLSHELVGHDKVETVFASLGEDRFKTIGSEVLELIYVETEILAFALWNILTAHGGLLEFHDKNHTEKISINVT